MDIRPILSTLARHKTAAALIVLEVALSCAIICNAVFLITQRLERIDRPTGLANEEIVRISMGNLGDNPEADALVKQDVASLRALPGVKAASSINHVPFDNSSWNSSIQLAPEQERPSAQANIYLGDAVVETLGLKLAEGRDFNQDEPPRGIARQGVEIDLRVEQLRMRWQWTPCRRHDLTDGR